MIFEPKSKNKYIYDVSLRENERRRESSIIITKMKKEQQIALCHPFAHLYATQLAPA